MFFYASFILLIAIILFGSKKNSYRCKLAFVIIWFVSAFRFDVGYDYSAYYTIMSPIVNNQEIERFELLPRMLALFCGNYSVPWLFFLVLSSIISILFYKTLRRFSKNLPLSIFLYLTLCFLPSLGVVRQAVAVAIVFYSYRYIIEKAFIKFLLAIIVASLFHVSALAFILLYFIYHYGRFFIIIIAGITCVIIKEALLVYLFNSGAIYSGYLDILSDIEGGSIMKYFYVLLFVVSYFLTKKYGVKSTENDKLLNILLLSIFIIPILGGHMGDRIVMYFIPFYLLLLPPVISKLTKGLQHLTILSFFLFFLFMIKVDSNNVNKSAYTPYRCIIMVDNKETFK